MNGSLSVRAQQHRAFRISADVQRALGSFSGQVTLSDDATLDASHAGMAIQWAGGDGGNLTLARTATLPLGAVAFLVYHHGAGLLNLLAQGGDVLWTGGPVAAPTVVLRPGEFALCLSRVNGEYDVPVTRVPVSADWDATDGVAQILHKPTSLGSLSGLRIELGYQPNGRGIDHGDHYELDFTMATNTFVGFQFTVNSDNSISAPTGMYLIDADAEINAPVEDDWQIPAQVTFSVCNGYGYPGVYQQAVRRFPELPLGTQKKGGTLGSLVLAGALWNSAGDHVWAGFSKVPGANTQTPS